VNLTLLYIDSKAVIPAKAGIQLRNTRFPRIKYGAGLVKPGMRNKEKEFMIQYTRTLEIMVEFDFKTHD
jgi:hypothetical protein